MPTLIRKWEQLGLYANPNLVNASNSDFTPTLICKREQLGLYANPNP